MLYLTAMHFNENADRIQMTTCKGKLVQKLLFPKAKKGQHHQTSKDRAKQVTAKQVKTNIYLYLIFFSKCSKRQMNKNTFFPLHRLCLQPDGPCLQIKLLLTPQLMWMCFRTCLLNTTDLPWRKLLSMRLCRVPVDGGSEPDILPCSIRKLPSYAQHHRWRDDNMNTSKEPPAPANKPLEGQVSASSAWRREEESTY